MGAILTRYLDTSLLVPLFVHEPKSTDTHLWLAGIGNAELVISEWAIVEFSSAVGIKRRTGQIDETARERMYSEFEAFIHLRARVVPVLSADFLCAAEFCDRWQMGLRAGDALHLAIADRHAMTVCTFDRTMIDAANALGLAIEEV